MRRISHSLKKSRVVRRPIGGDALTRKPLLYFAPDVTDAKLFDRVRAFRSQSFDVMSVGFARRRYDTGQTVDWPHVHLGTVADGSLLARLTGLAGLALGTRQMRAHLKGGQHGVVIARNLDMALMARIMLLCLPRSRFVYECLDIRPLMVKPSKLGRFARWLERKVLARADALWTSSPGFVENYFHAYQKYSGPVNLIENKIAKPFARLSTTPPDGPWRIGWFGTLRCARSLDLICALAERLGDRVVFHLHGYPARIGEDTFVAAIKPYSNIEMRGPYAPADLPGMLADVHFSWGFDYSDTWGNSQWLLPNRFYEAGYYHRPVLADATQQSGLLVEATSAGWIFEGATLQNDLIAFFETLSKKEWQQCVTGLSQQSDAAYSGTDDIAQALRSLEIRP